MNFVNIFVVVYLVSFVLLSIEMAYMAYCMGASNFWYFCMVDVKANGWKQPFKLLAGSPVYATILGWTMITCPTMFRYMKPVYDTARKHHEQHCS